MCKIIWSEMQLCVCVCMLTEKLHIHFINDWYLVSTHNMLGSVFHALCVLSQFTPYHNPIRLVSVSFKQIVK